MPIYEFQCIKCNKVKERYVSHDDINKRSFDVNKAAPTCCEKSMKFIVSAVSFAFNGSCHKNDYDKHGRKPGR